jgi:hypothetical protein
VKAISRIRLIFAFIKLSLGFGFHDDLVQNLSFKNNAVVQVNTEQISHVDGEHVTARKDYNFRIISESISVISGI